MSAEWVPPPKAIRKVKKSTAFQRFRRTVERLPGGKTREQLIVIPAEVWPELDRVWAEDGPLYTELAKAGHRKASVDWEHGDDGLFVWVDVHDVAAVEAVAEVLRTTLTEHYSHHVYKVEVAEPLVYVAPAQTIRVAAA